MPSRETEEALQRYPAGEDAQTLVDTQASPGTSIYTAPDTDVGKRFYLEACNTDDVDVTVTVEWSGTAAKDRVVMLLPPLSGAVGIICGRRIHEDLVVRAYATIKSVVNVYKEISR